MNAMESRGVTIVRCDAAAQADVLALAEQAWPKAERAAYEQAITALITGGLADRVVLVAAQEQEQLLAAQLAQILPGRAAVVWQPQFRTADTPRCDSLAVMLFSRLVCELVLSGAHLAQGLVPPGDEIARRLFTLGGFSPAAELLYLSAELNGRRENPPALPFEIETFMSQAEPRLVQLLDRTYTGTLDCPRIDGLRKTDDVIAGYKSVGEFRPELWQIARHGGEDVGCVLVNLHSDVKHAELTYMGLVPEVRGRGWGLLLTQQALWLAGQEKCDRTVLAVDAENRPAIHLYARAGFSEFDRRAVWIHPLS